jgi:hypothetical protein
MSIEPVMREGGQQARDLTNALASDEIYRLMFVIGGTSMSHVAGGSYTPEMPLNRERHG